MSEQALLPHLRFAGDLQATFDEVWLRLSRGVKDRRSAMRHPTIATIGSDGQPSARTVVLREANRQRGALVFHTDVHSAKIAEIETMPTIALHIWDDSCMLQVRMTATAKVLTGDRVRDIWSAVPEGSRAAYGAVPVPGTAIARADAFSLEPTLARFAVVDCELTRIETLCLTPVQHYRAVFARHNDWSGQWLTP